MAATASEAYMLELVAQGCEWIKSEQGGAMFSIWKYTKLETPDICLVTILPILHFITNKLPTTC